MSKIKPDGIQEEISITTNTSYLNEKSLEKENNHTEYAFTLITCTFVSSIFIQLIRLIPNSYIIALQIPIILLALFIAVNMIVFLNNKKFSVKAYLLIGFITLGLVIGL